MSTVGDEGRQLTAALVGGRRFREKCLARYLEMSGVRVTIGVVEELRESLLSQRDNDRSRHIRYRISHLQRADHRVHLGMREGDLPDIPIVAVSDREDRSAVLDALRHSVRAYFPSSLDPEILIATLRFVQKGGTFIPLEVLIDARVHPQRQRSDSKPTEMRGLTPSEQRVLELLRVGKPNKVIARELNIEESTVKVHVRRIMRKLNAANRTQAALVAQQMAYAVA